MIARHIAANFVNLLIICFVVLAGSIYWANKQYQSEGQNDQYDFMGI